MLSLAGSASIARPAVLEIRDRDVAVLGCDMHDAMPDKDGLP